MEKYLLFNTRDVKTVINCLLKNAETTTCDDVDKVITSYLGTGYNISESDFQIPEEEYDEEIVLPEYDYKTDNKMCLELSKILLDQIYAGKEKITLTKEQIESLLINRNNDTVNKKIFYALCDLRADMTGVDLSGLYIHGLDFRGLKNLVIDLDKVKEKDFINVNFAGVTLKGSLDGCKLFYTRFGRSINDLKLDPQKIKHKSMKCTNLADITIDGSFDGVKIDYCDFTYAKGKKEINPQTVYGKTLEGIILHGVTFVGENGSKPSFKGCQIKYCNFDGIKGCKEINLEEPEYYIEEEYDGKKIKTKMAYCNLRGVTLTGNVRRSELENIVYGCYTDWMSHPNRSATTEQVNMPYNGPVFCQLVYLNGKCIYERKDLDIRIKIKSGFSFTRKRTRE